MKYLMSMVAGLLVLFMPLPVIAEDIEVDMTAELVMYVSTGCPHCEKVEKFIEDNALQDEITIKDTIADPGVSEEYTELLDGMGVPVEDRGVPLLVYGEDAYITGDTPIISYLSERYGIAAEEEAGDTKQSYSSQDYLLLFGGGGFVLAIVGYGAYNSIKDRKK